MSGNPLPWIVLAAIVLVSLHAKGYLKFPVSKPGFQGPSAPAIAQTVAPVSGVDIDKLAGMGSYALGLAFAKAVRAEAESTIANRIATDAAATMHERFTAPFSTPEPAGHQDPNQAGVKP